MEQGQAPERIIASKITNGGVSFTRPLWPYPQLPKYLGGNVNDAASFACME